MGRREDVISKLPIHPGVEMGRREDMINKLPIHPLAKC